MKKILVLGALVCMVFFANAQLKPQAGSVSTEVGLRLFSIGIAEEQIQDIMNGNVGNIELNNPININGIKVRYFLTENMVVRGTLNFSMRTSKDYSTVNDVEQISKTTFMNFAFTPGIEYHFQGSERLSPYVGAEIGFGLGSVKTHTDNAGHTSGSLAKSKTPHNSFNVGLVTGVDFYITSGLYLGAEFGFGFNTFKQKGATITTEYNGIKNEIENKDYSKFPSFGFTPNTAIRLGWKF